jgi:hypothetical protein
MNLRPDQAVFSTEHIDDGCCSGAFNTMGVMPPTEEFKPGDLVHYYDRPDCIGLITARAPQEVEYSGLSAWEPENIREAKRTGGKVKGKATIDFYTVVWNNGRIRTAGAHMLHQLRRVA